MFGVIDHARYLARWELSGVTGVAVVVDVIRAFTTAAYAFDGGATRIYLADTVGHAIEMGRAHVGALIMGEEHGRIPPGFHLPNSPVAVSQADVAGRVLVQRTSAGTRGVLAAQHIPDVFAASLVCATATARAVTAVSRGRPPTSSRVASRTHPGMAQTTCKPPRRSNERVPAWSGTLPRSRAASRPQGRLSGPLHLVRPMLIRTTSATRRVSMHSTLRCVWNAGTG